MRDTLTTLIGKGVRQLARLRGGGSALPGFIVEKIDPAYMRRTLDKLPHGVVVISGTNGKTTTTKMVVELFESQGLRVFTNRTGSNFTRGVVAAAVAEASLGGRLDADIAVLELDEAHAMHFIARVAPDYALLLNVLRDQLDRFGELDTTAEYLRRIAEATTRGVLLNREDPLVARIGLGDSAQRALQGRLHWYGLAPELRHLFPSDADLVHGNDTGSPKAALRQSGGQEAGGEPVADVALVALGEGQATFDIAGERRETPLQLSGVYNAFNAAAALALVRLVLVDRGLPSNTSRLVEALADVRPAFGRGERLELDGQPLELVLVKNPAGFRLALASFDPARVATMIAINDQHADGRDMSWLWDVQFASLAGSGVDVVSGARAWDMALRLEHDDVQVRRVEDGLVPALDALRAAAPDRPRRIFCTYTAMLALREHLSKVTDVEEVW